MDDGHHPHKKKALKLHCIKQDRTFFNVSQFSENLAFHRMKKEKGQTNKKEKVTLVSVCVHFFKDQRSEIKMDT